MWNAHTSVVPFAFDRDVTVCHTRRPRRHTPGVTSRDDDASLQYGVLDLDVAVNVLAVVERLRVRDYLVEACPYLRGRDDLRDAHVLRGELADDAPPGDR